MSDHPEETVPDLLHIVEKAIAERWRQEGLQSDSDPEFDAEAALLAVLGAGWRIVRVHYAWPGDNGGIAMLVDEEWTP